MTCFLTLRTLLCLNCSRATRNYKERTVLYIFQRNEINFFFKLWSPLETHKLYVIGMLRNRFCLFPPRKWLYISWFFQSTSEYCLGLNVPHIIRGHIENKFFYHRVLNIFFISEYIKILFLCFLIAPNLRQNNKGTSLSLLLAFAFGLLKCWIPNYLPGLMLFLLDFAAGDSLIWIQLIFWFSNQMLEMLDDQTACG